MKESVGSRMVRLCVILIKVPPIFDTPRQCFRFLGSQFIALVKICWVSVPMGGVLLTGLYLLLHGTYPRYALCCLGLLRIIPFLEKLTISLEALWTYRFNRFLITHRYLDFLQLMTKMELK
ncbi:hypothetical protein RHMOL_Rhmol06G0151300 [Rhododendron molle]|uniref:Uncharacterized protein n=1 Tax=Rhododendron molle TaxID=49168 RepID=A0ACC0NE12_RHOML|nr:hypothetical protein RHMOL_Rhmol06G0151300 [Rhododendron molle]